MTQIKNKNPHLQLFGEQNTTKNTISVYILIQLSRTMI